MSIAVTDPVDNPGASLAESAVLDVDMVAVSNVFFAMAKNSRTSFWRPESANWCLLSDNPKCEGSPGITRFVIHRKPIVVYARAFACTSCYHAGMKKQAPVQYTIRGVPAEVDDALRRKAARRKLSLNQIVVEELTASAIGVQRRADFSDLVGRWTSDPAFDEIIAAQRRIDWDKWK